MILRNNTAERVTDSVPLRGAARPSALSDALSLLAAIRKQGFAERDPMVQPRSSNTIAVPIVLDGRVLATVGMTYFTSALDRDEIVRRYVPLLKSLAGNIASSVSSLQEGDAGTNPQTDDRFETPARFHS